MRAGSTGGPMADIVGDRPAHPGAVLREDVLPALGLGVSEVASRLGVSRQALHNVLTERAALSVGMALLVSRLVGGEAQMWLAMQNAHDLWAQRRALAAVLDGIVPAHRRG